MPKCSMCENKKHLEPCKKCADKTVIYCRVCIRKHHKKVHNGKGDEDQRGITMGDVLVEQKQFRYRCEPCKTSSKNGGKCPECGEVMKRVKV